MAVSAEPLSAPETRHRLLEAAGEVFARQGLRNATVREICARAGANVAAVSYHFGGKQELYAAALQDCARTAIEKYPPDLGVAAGAPPEERLRAFVRALLLRILDEGRPAWHGRLMMREVAEPSAALGGLVDKHLRPMFDRLRGIVRELLGGRPSERFVRRCSASVLGQCLFYKHCQPILAHLLPELRYDSAAIEELADHITRFSLTALARSRKSAR